MGIQKGNDKWICLVYYEVDQFEKYHDWYFIGFSSFEGFYRRTFDSREAVSIYQRLLVSMLRHLKFLKQTEHQTSVSFAE
jgi:hypothetical protein